MKKFNLVFTGIVIGLIFGLWFGVNIGKDRNIFSNPFAERDIPQTIKQKTGEAMEKAGKEIEKLGEDIKGKMQE